LELGLGNGDWGSGGLGELVTHTVKIQIQNQSVCHMKYVTSSSYHKQATATLATHRHRDTDTDTDTTSCAGGGARGLSLCVCECHGGNNFF